MRLIDWFQDMRGRAYEQGITLEPLTLYELQTYGHCVEETQTRQGDVHNKRRS